MDEADLLGDRIAIMARGQLRCAGSPLFLKKHYGVGYQMTIIKKTAKRNLLNGIADNEIEKAEKGAAIDEVSKDECSKENLESGRSVDDVLEGIVKGAVPSATVLSNLGTEMSFQLPIGESASFIGMFEQLDDQMKQHKIETYGVSITTLDEVFLMVARGEEGLHLSSETKGTEMIEEEGKVVSSNIYRASLGVHGKGTFKRHIRALFLKRAINFRRDKKAW